MHLNPYKQCRGIINDKERPKVPLESMTELLEKPQPPADDDCCGGGACNPCVWDHYYAERKKWRLQQVELKEKLAQEIKPDQQ